MKKIRVAYSDRTLSYAQSTGDGFEEDEYNTIMQCLRPRNDSWDYLILDIGKLDVDRML